MRFIRLILTICVIGILSYVTFTKLHINDYIDDFQIEEALDIMEIEKQTEEKALLPFLDADIYQLIGKSINEVTALFDESLRKDITPYGYTWWIYTDESTYQLQIGIEDEMVETIFLTGEGLQSEPFQIGASYDALKAQFPFEREVVYEQGLAMYRFKLTAEQLAVNPLIKISEDVFVQCYFDSFTDTLSSLRVVTGDKLLEQRPYELEYRGTLPVERDISSDEWKGIEDGMKAQILSITNIYRNRFQLPALQLDDAVSEVAYRHSKDMSEQDYFSHTSINGNTLQDRLLEQEVSYRAAGENIAARYVDAPAAMEGWLNSEGHREALLHERFTHIGIGVFRLFYTQNFLQK